MWWKIRISFKRVWERIFAAFWSSIEWSSVVWACYWCTIFLFFLLRTWLGLSGNSQTFILFLRGLFINGHWCYRLKTKWNCLFSKAGIWILLRFIFLIQLLRNRRQYSLGRSRSRNWRSRCNHWRRYFSWAPFSFVELDPLSIHQYHLVHFILLELLLNTVDVSQYFMCFLFVLKRCVLLT